MENKKNTVIYYAHKFPFPAIDGGEQAIYSHIKEMQQINLDLSLKFFFSNSNNKSISENDVQYHIFEIKKYNKLIENLLRFLYVFFSLYPAFYHFIATKEIKSAIKNNNPDLIILEGAFGNLTIPPKRNYKLIYIAHDVAYEITSDAAKVEKNLFLKILKYINAFKMDIIERKTCLMADKIICISSSDYKHFKKLYPDKTLFIPHRINIKDDLWKTNNSKQLFFCAHLDFFPNYEAVEWIVNYLSPELPKDIKIKISGKDTDNVPEEWKKDNIEFLGFVSKEELINLYKTSGAFLCPISYGSGVKLKLTEALSYGMPIIATREALEGLDYIKIKPLINRGDLKETVANIEKLLNNQELLENCSKNALNQIRNFQAENDYSYEKVLNEIIN